MSSNNNNNNNQDPADFRVRSTQNSSTGGGENRVDPRDFQMYLTEDEKRVISECKTESFMRRSIPFMVAGSALFHAAVKRNLISNYGYLAKQIFVVTSAYVAGRLSYAGECKKKIMQQLPPDSNLVRLMNNQPLVPSPHQQQQQQSSVQIASTNDQSQMKPEGFTSYDELRKRNREAGFAVNTPPPLPQRQAPVSQPQSQQDAFGDFDQGSFKPKPSTTEQYTDKQRKVRKNQYGDFIYGDE